MRELLTFATENIAGDPDTWPETFAWSSIAFAVAGILIGWFKWGKAAYNEEDRQAMQSGRYDPPMWKSSTTTITTKPQPPKEDDAPDA